MIGFLRETLGTFLLTLLVVVAYSTAMVCLWHFMLDFLSPSWRPASWAEMALFLVWVGVHVLWAAPSNGTSPRASSTTRIPASDGVP